MKTEFSVAEVAAALGVSKKTVYRAIHRSGMVKPSTQKYILDYIQANYSKDSVPAQEKIHAKVITVVVQKKPKFFWQPIINEMQNALSAYPEEAIRLRTICFSGMPNDTELRTILSEISPENTDGLIVVPVNTIECLNALREMSHVFPVVVLDDYFDCDDTPPEGEDDFCYVHSNGVLEGAEIADLVAMSGLKEKNILILNFSLLSCHCKDRIRGFRTRITQHDPNCIIEELDLSHLRQGEYNFNTTLPSQLAREIAQYLTTHPDRNINCFYIPTGMLAQICAAQVKLRRGDIFCFGHEINDTAQRFFDGGIRGGYVNNDIPFQSHTAIQIIAEKLLYGLEPQKRGYVVPFSSTLIAD